MKNNKRNNLAKEIEEKMISYLKENVDLKQNINELNNEREDLEKRFILEMISILDSLDTKFENYEERVKSNSLSGESLKIVDNFRSINRKIIRILQSLNVEEIKFEDSKARIGDCNVIETKPNPDMENESILITIKKGYRREDKVLRKAEIITVKN